MMIMGNMRECFCVISDMEKKTFVRIGNAVCTSDIGGEADICKDGSLD